METIKLKGLDEVIYYTESKDGLPIYIWENPYVKSFYLSLNVKYGSIDTEFKIKNKKYKVPDGIAHFMEHIKFNVKKDMTANDLFDPLGSEINAFTTFKYTSYLVYGTNKLQENLNALLDYVINPYFTKDIIKKERGIIASEINMGYDDAYNRLFYEFNKSIYHKEKFRNLITGTESDIKNIDLDNIELVYKTFYQPKNMFLVVTGNVNAYEIEKIVNDNLSKKDIPKYIDFEILQPKEPKNVYKKENTIVSNIEVNKAKIGLKIPKNKFNMDKVKLNIILATILNINFGDTSDLKEELLQKGLITYLNANRTIGNNYVIIDITLESNYLDEAIKRVIDTLNNLVIKEEDLKRKLNSAIANLVINYEDVEDVNNLIQSYIINYKDIVPNVKEIYESIKIDDVNDVLENISTKEMTIIKMVGK